MMPIGRRRPEAAVLEPTAVITGRAYPNPESLAGPQAKAACLQYLQQTLKALKETLESKVHVVKPASKDPLVRTAPLALVARLERKVPQAQRVPRESKAPLVSRVPQEREARRVQQAPRVNRGCEARLARKETPAL